MPQVFLQILAVASFIPHGHCYLWNSRLVWLHIASDLLIALAYYSIPITLVYFVRKRPDLPYAGIFLLFGAFIISCGTTHLMEIWTLWHPNYWSSGVLKAITALISLYTALELIPIVPKALSLSSPAQLKKANQILESEIAERQRAEQRLSLQSSTALILAESSSFREATPKLLQTICSHLGWDWGELWGFNQNDFDSQHNPYLSTQPLRCFQIWHSSSVDFSEFETKTWQMTFLPGEGLPGRVWANQKAAWVEDVVRDNNFLRQSIAQREGLHGAFAFPIRMEGQVLGVFAFFSRQIRQPQSELLELFETLGSQIGQFIVRKWAEKALQNSQLLLSGVLNSSLDGIMAFQSVRDRQENIVDFQWLTVNPAAEKMVGRTQDELFGKRLLEEMPGNREAGLFDLYVRVVQTGEPIEKEFYYNHDGIEAWFLNTAVKLGDGFTVTFRDISERKRSEEAIQESQERFRLAFNDAAVGMTLVSLQEGFLQVNRALCDIVGYTEAELLATDFQTITHPDDLDADLEYVRQLLAGEIRSYQMEKRYIHKRGQVVWIVLSVSLVRDLQGQPLYFIAQIKNISSRKNAEQALRESEERLQLALEGSGDGLWDWNIVTNEVYLSQRWMEMLGYEVGELPANANTWESLIHPDDKPWVIERLNAHFRDGSVPYDFDYRVLMKSGEWKWIANYGKVVARDENNQPLRMTGTHKDISDRKQAEEALRKSEERWQLVIRGNNDGIWDWNIKTNEVVYSPRWKEILGYADYEIANHFEEWEKRVHPDDLDRAVQDLQAHIQKETPFYVNEHRLRGKDGTYRWILDRGQVQWDEQGNAIRMVGSCSDITERKQTEEALRESEARWQFALEGSGDGVWDWNAQMNTVFFSRQWKTMLGYAEQEVGNSLEEWDSRVHPDDKAQCYADLNKHFSGETPIYHNEHRVRCKDGSYKWILDRGKVIEWTADGQPLRVIGTHTDISDRKRSEEQIATSLTEKEVLLKEIHHRVKNNLQIICSLLNLQARSLKDLAITALFKETQNRVRSMALVHEKLYQSNNLSKIDLAEYLQDLMINLFRSYSINSSKITLKVQFNENTFLDIDVAVPCGLIVNELISNALKYAFEPGNKGEILLQSVIDEQQNIILTIQDNGKGLPDGFELEKSQTLGLKLVKNLTNQLRGQLELDSSSGTKFQLTFPKKNDQ